jgi:hypothetical protein
VNDYHEPRSGGDHDSTDLLAPIGTNALAIEAGTIQNLGWDDSGGNKLWLHGVSGTRYYYAHLSDYLGTYNGMQVTQGQVIAKTGDTGNAAGGPPHLHLSMSLDGTYNYRSTANTTNDANNPYPYLADASDGKEWCPKGGVTVTETANVNLVPNLDGTLALFYRGNDRRPWMTNETGPSQTQWAGHTNLDGYITGNPVVGRNLDGRLQAFYRGGDKQAWTTWQNGANQYASWSGVHKALGGQLQMASEPAVIRNSDGRLQMFYRGYDGNIWTTWQTSANVPDSWQQGHLMLGATGTTSPVVAKNVDGKIVLLWTNAGGGLVTRTQATAGVPDSWGAATQLGGALQSGFTVGTNLTGALEVFYRGSTDKQVWHLWQTTPGGAFNSGHYPLGGQVVGRPTVARNADGRLEVFYRGEDSKAWHLWQLSPSGSWSGHTTENGTLTADPSLSVNADGRLQLAYRGYDAQPWTLYQMTPNGGWSGHTPLGGQVD